MNEIIQLITSVLDNPQACLWWMLSLLSMLTFVILVQEIGLVSLFEYLCICISILYDVSYS